MEQNCIFEEKNICVSEGYTLGADNLEQDENLNKIYSIICENNCSYAFLGKQVYSQIKFQKVKNGIRDLIEFLKTTQIFKNFEEIALVETILGCEEINIQYNVICIQRRR